MSDMNEWLRFEFVSLWAGPDIELVVLQEGGSSEAWRWTARGWREPEDWSEPWASREQAERAALQFYLQKD